jgi:spermidine/putrescine transport system permease protein
MTRLRAVFLTPAALLMLATLAIPMVIVGVYSFLSRGAYGGVEAPWTDQNYVRLLDPLYATIFLRSAWISLLASVGCLVLGFPLALFIARSGPRKNLYLALVMLPFWTSFLIRLYAWMFLLRDTGLINTILQAAGLIHAPLPMLYNQGAVLLGMIYGYLPFAVLPLYATLERQDPALLDAAADLGASPWKALARVTIPLAAPGIWAAAILVFVPCIGTYIVSDLLGGSKTVLIGNLVQNQFTASRDWPFGAAASMILLIAAIAVLALMRRAREELL